MSDPVFHQGFLPFPKLDAPFVDEQGNITIPWYRTLMRIWQVATASGKVNFQNAVTFSSQGASSASGNPILAVSPSTGVPVGQVITPDTVLDIVSAIGVPPDPPPSLGSIGDEGFIKGYQLNPPDPQPDLLAPVLLSCMLDIGL